MTTSVALIKASDGTGNASVATVQATRLAGATTIDVDTVAGIPATFIGSMGTPHTFTDPITGETLTVISEATAVDFAGHTSAGNLEIDTIAPGYTDAGSVAGDIVIIRPTTQWANNLAAVLGVSMNDDGTLKAVTANPGWTGIAQNPNTVTANGNRSYNLVFNGVDLTSVLTPGARLRFQRTVTAPTQCTSLNGTSQYFVKTTPNKLTFTDDFVVSAWVKLTSYATASIASRYNGTSGWDFGVDSSGRIQMLGYNSGVANVSYVNSYQSIPLNKWVHVTAQLDMSAFTATTTTSYVMLDGVDVPALVTRGGTNPTALIQAGNLEIGSRNAGTLFFPGKIAQVAIYNAKVTQAVILASIHQTLSGSETSLASAYSFSNSIIDLNTTTPNDLSVGGGSAVATNLDTPFTQTLTGITTGTLNFGILTAISFSTNTTLTVQLPEGGTIPTSGGISSVSYSDQKAPYGFPTQRGKWIIEYRNRSSAATAALSANVWSTFVGTQLAIPIGEWIAAVEGNVILSMGGATTVDPLINMSTLQGAGQVDNTMGAGGYLGGLTSASFKFTVNRTHPQSLAAATNYYLNGKIGAVSGTSTLAVDVNGTDFVMKAELALL